MQKTITSTSGDKEGPVSVPIVEQQEVHGLLRTFVALRHRNFRLFWFGQMISLVGTWMQSTAQAWLVLQLTHSAWLLGVVGALQFLPILVLALFGGVLADRLPKRKVLLFTQSSAMIQATILWILVATGHIQVWHIMILASLLGLTNALDMPTRQAFVPEMVGLDKLPNAIALNSSLFNMARVLGPGLGGLLIAWLGVAPLFLLNAISFIAVIVGLALIDTRKLFDSSYLAERRKARTEQSPLQSLREGLVYVWRTPAVFLVIAVVGVVSLFGINFNVVLPLFATSVLHAGAIGFGFLSSAIGLGALVSALWIAWGNHRPTIRFMLLAGLIFSVAEICFAISPIYILSLLLIASVGFAQIAFSAVANTTLQTITPGKLRGRVMSVYMMVFAGSTPVGNLFIGGIAHLYSAPIALLAGGLLSLLAATLGWIWRKPAEKDLAANFEESHESPLASAAAHD